MISNFIGKRYDLCLIWECICAIPQVLFISQKSRHAHLSAVPVLSNFVNVVTRNTLSSSYSVVACSNETSADHCKDGTNVTSNGIRPYQVVVAATREMGIAKDGKLPWNLPSDLRYFKEVTTATSLTGKKNAVIMGRRTWESIPQKYRPLPGRLNIVLTRSGSVRPASLHDLLICSDLLSALRLLAEPPHSSSVEKVFVIGGGQVLEEALNGPRCEAIHLTDIETDIQCDTFIPRIDQSTFCQLHSSRQMVENNVRFSFVTHVRKSNSAEDPSTSENSNKSNGNIETKETNMGCFSRKQADFDVVMQIQEDLTNR